MEYEQTYYREQPAREDPISGALPVDGRPLPSVEAYDELLARRRDHQPSISPDGSAAAPETRNEVS